MNTGQFIDKRQRLVIDYGHRLVAEDLYNTHAGFKKEVDALAKYAHVTPQKIVASLLNTWNEWRQGVAA